MNMAYVIGINLSNDDRIDDLSRCGVHTGTPRLAAMGGAAMDEDDDDDDDDDDISAAPAMA